MSRSGYSDDCDYLGLYRANVDRAIAGKRGQKFLREMADALDALPVKELIEGDLVDEGGAVCAIGAVAVKRGIDVSKIDPYDGGEVGTAFGIARTLACEIAYENDERPFIEGVGRLNRPETPAERWQRMRKWVDANLAKENADADR